MSFKEFIIQSCQGVKGEISSKRITLFCSVLIFMIMCLVDLFTLLSPSQFIYEGVLWVILASLGGATADKFGLYLRENKNKNTKQTIDATPNQSTSTNLLTDTPTHGFEQ